MNTEGGPEKLESNNYDRYYLPRHPNSELATEKRNANLEVKLHFGEEKDKKIGKDGDCTKMETGRGATVDKGA